METKTITISIERYNELVKAEMILDFFERAHKKGSYLGDSDKEVLFGLIRKEVVEEDDF